MIRYRSGIRVTRGEILVWQKGHVLLNIRHSCGALVLAVFVGALTRHSGAGFQSRRDMQNDRLASLVNPVLARELKTSCLPGLGRLGALCRPPIVTQGAYHLEALRRIAL